MNDESLKSLCLFGNSRKNINQSNWTIMVYSLGKYIKEYGFCPSFLPILIYTDHGPNLTTNVVAPHELINNCPVQFYHNHRLVEEFKKLSKKPCYTMYSPSVYYRRKNKIEANKDAKGTIVFPSHSTKLIDNLMNWDGYIDQLKNLPEKFQPISICFHMSDIEKNLHKLFLEKGFDVYTAGNIYDERFAERFYDILRKFKYSSSNLIGSYTFYSVEMGIPFFLFGNSPIYYNHGDPNIEKGNYCSYKSQDIYMELERMFSEASDQVTVDQKKYIEEALGLYHGISRIKMAFILYYSFIVYMIKSRFFIKSFIKKFLKILKNFTRPVRRKIVKILWKTK